MIGKEWYQRIYYSIIVPLKIWCNRNCTHNSLKHEQWASFGHLMKKRHRMTKSTLLHQTRVIKNNSHGCFIDCLFHRQIQKEYKILPRYENDTIQEQFKYQNSKMNGFIHFIHLTYTNRTDLLYFNSNIIIFHLIAFLHKTRFILTTKQLAYTFSTIWKGVCRENYQLVSVNIILGL